jgi:hypothetical protein
MEGMAHHGGAMEEGMKHHGQYPGKSHGYGGEMQKEQP